MSKEKYLSLPRLQQQLPVFFQPWWLDIVSGNWNIALAGTEDNITGVWPYAIDKKLGLKIVRNPLLTPYLGPFFLSPGAAEAVLFEHLWQQLPHWDSFDLEATVAFKAPQLLQQKGLDVTEKVTYEINLEKSEEKLWSHMHSNHRNLIRQASAAYEIAEGPEYCSRLLELHKETFTRKKKPYPFQPSKIALLVKESIDRNAGNLFVLKEGQQEPNACIFTVWDKEKMYLLLSAMDTEKAHPGAIRLLIWHAIKAAKQRGAKVFDFEGSMDPGIAAFFRRFGGERKTYLCASANRSFLWRMKKAVTG